VEQAAVVRLPRLLDNQLLEQAAAAEEAALVEALVLEQELVVVVGQGLTPQP
jgi:hypothetical protein